MKKIIVILSVVILVLCYNTETKKITIPNNAIRIRIIANSNNIEDQLTKLKVKEQVENNIYTKIANTKNLYEARNMINNDIKTIENIVNDIIPNNNYEINYGNNYFPKKTMYGINYDEGYYESLVIKLGAGKGDNWWCVLFPPLCMIDAKKNDTEFVEYKSKVLEILNRYN